MADPTREQLFALAAQHSDQTICNRERALQGWNFSKDGLLAFVRAARELEATPQEADRAQWEAHIRMERQAHAERDPNTETGDGTCGATAPAEVTEAMKVAGVRELFLTDLGPKPEAWEEKIARVYIAMRNAGVTVDRHQTKCGTDADALPPGFRE